jgi:Tol biopolymer transport system component
VTLVSAAADTGAANGPSTPLAISSDGRYVVFSSSASNLTADPLPGGCEPARGCNAEIFIRDLQAGTTELVSRSVDGQAANLPSGAAAVSDDGRYVAFVSFATNLVVADTNAAADVFLRDRVANTVRRVDVGASGGQANGACDPQVLAMTPDASVIAYSTTASNLGPRDTAGTWDVYLRDRSAALTRRVSQRPDGRPAPGRSLFPSLSADGTTVAFMSIARLVNSDGTGSWDIYVRSRTTGQLTRVPLSTTGIPRLSADGAQIGFPSADPRLGHVPKGSTQAVLWNLSTGRFRIASLDGANASSGTVMAVSLSEDGGAAAYDTTAGDILPVDRNAGSDIIVQLLDPPSA